MRLGIVILLLIISHCVYSQNFTISGIIKCQESGETLIGTSVSDAKTHGTISNNFGFYSLSLPSGKYEILYSYVGYSPARISIDLRKDTTINTFLTPNTIVKEIRITNQKHSSEQHTIRISDIQKLPSVGGEIDPIKAFQLLLGVGSGTEGMSGLFVRGGSNDQNLILLDDVPIYNASHLFGFFSIFNPDAIKSVNLYKGAFPARYGGRLSSVLDIRLKDGNSNRLKINATLGLIASKLTIETPIVNNKTTFIISGRRTYYDIVSKPFVLSSHKQYHTYENSYYFYDISSKISHTFSEKSKIFLSGYLGKDKWFSYKEKSENQLIDNSNLQWGNATAALRWNYTLNQKLFSNTTLTYTSYQYNISQKYRYIDSSSYKNSAFKNSSQLNDLTFKTDFDYYLSTNQTVQFGAAIVNHTYTPNTNSITTYQSLSNKEVDTIFRNPTLYTTEYEAYIEDQIIFNDVFFLNIGLRTSCFISNSKLFNSLQPRLSFKYQINNILNIEGAYTQMQQNLHLLTNSTVNLPTDLWLPATQKVPPESTQQYSLGINLKLSNVLNVRINQFYKTMNHLIEYQEGTGITTFQNWEDIVEIGKGKSYGTEFLLEKTAGTTKGWISYTWSRTDRQFENINFGKTFPYKYDRRHNFSIVVEHDFSKNISLSTIWIYMSGNAVSLPVIQYMSSNYDFIKYYNGRNGYRMPSTHRLDVALTIIRPQTKYTNTWQFGIYNVYNQQNPYYIYASTEGKKTVFKQVSLFPIIPYVSFNLKF